MATVIGKADAARFEEVRDGGCGFGEVAAGAADGEDEVAECEGVFRGFEVLVHLVWISELLGLFVRWFVV